jgi:hypothetical protein
VYSFFNFSFTVSCWTSPSILKYLYAIPCSIYILFPSSITGLSDWTNLYLLNAPFAHLSIQKSIWIGRLKFLNTWYCISTCVSVLQISRVQ